MSSTPPPPPPRPHPGPASQSTALQLACWHLLASSYTATSSESQWSGASSSSSSSSCISSAFLSWLAWQKLCPERILGPASSYDMPQGTSLLLYLLVFVSAAVRGESKLDGNLAPRNLSMPACSPYPHICTGRQSKQLCITSCSRPQPPLQPSRRALRLCYLAWPRLQHPKGHV